MPGLALLLWLVFGLFALGGRILLQLKRTGSTGVTGISGAAGSVEWWGGLLFVGSLAAAGVAPVLELTEVVEPIDALDTTAVQVAGLVLYALGFAICVGAQLAMGTSWRIGVDESERTELVTDGPFAIVRNPIYSGVIPLVAGLTLLAPNPVAAGAFVALVAAFEIQVRLVEEPHLLRAHDPAYCEYAASGGSCPASGACAPRVSYLFFSTSQTSLAGEPLVGELGSWGASRLRPALPRAPRDASARAARRRGTSRG